MSEALFDDMKRYIGLSDSDAAILASLAGPLRPHFPAIVAEFYEVLQRHPHARAVLAAQPGRLERLRASLGVWLEELFSGTYDQAYFERRARIGRIHVQVGLPQHYMFTAMNVVRLALCDRIAGFGTGGAFRSMAAVHKLLDLELAIMNQTYREDLVLKMQAVEQANYERRIGESEHLATIGQLAASLAHEIKNPLAGISGAIQVLAGGLPSSHPHKPILDEALRQIDRLDSAVRDLLIYARPKAPEKSRTDLSQVVTQAATLLREEPSFRKVRVQVANHAAHQYVQADEAQMQQVMTNLLLNAAHACDGNGEIRIQLSPTVNGVRLEIRDNGGGMSPEVLKRAFEPFYTTKAKGTGLGLSICKRIVEAHNGQLTIESQAGRGTRVVIELPAGT